MSDLFEKEDLENKSEFTCRSCLHKGCKQYETRNIWYCVATLDNKTECGFKKIKLKNPSCIKFEFCYNTQKGNN
jgi:hypothetical protein